MGVMEAWTVRELRSLMSLVEVSGKESEDVFLEEQGRPQA